MFRSSSQAGFTHGAGFFFFFFEVNKQRIKCEKNMHIEIGTAWR